MEPPLSPVTRVGLVVASMLITSRLVGLRLHSGMNSSATTRE